MNPAEATTRLRNALIAFDTAISAIPDDERCGALCILICEAKGAVGPDAIGVCPALMHQLVDQFRRDLFAIKLMTMMARGHIEPGDWSKDDGVGWLSTPEGNRLADATK